MGDESTHAAWVNEEGEEEDHFQTFELPPTEFISDSKGSGAAASPVPPENHEMKQSFYIDLFLDLVYFKQSNKYKIKLQNTNNWIDISNLRLLVMHWLEDIYTNNSIIINHK